MLRKQQYVKWIITDFSTWSLQSRLNYEDVLISVMYFTAFVLLDLQRGENEPHQAGC